MPPMHSGLTLTDAEGDKRRCLPRTDFGGGAGSIVDVQVDVLMKAAMFSVQLVEILEWGQRGSRRGKKRLLSSICILVGELNNLIEGCVMGLRERARGFVGVQRELYLKSPRGYFRNLRPCDLSDKTDDRLRWRVQEGFPVYGREQRLLRGFPGIRTQIEQSMYCRG